MTSRPRWASFRSDDGGEPSSQAASAAPGPRPGDEGPGPDTGRLLATVEVLVYEDRAEARITFPDQTSPVPDVDPSRIAEVAARARDELETWT